MDNSKETDEGFDAQNTEALIRLLLSQPLVEKIEVDPFVMELLPGIRGDQRVIPRGSRHIPDSRRDVDNHMFVTFRCASVELELVPDYVVGPGKWIWGDLGDFDGDGIPDFADGYDSFPDHYGAEKVDSFAKLIIRFPDWLDLDLAEFALIYSDSDPSAVERSDEGPPFDYFLPEDGGAYRIWTRDGPEPRNKAPIDEEGDFIASNERYPVNALELEDDNSVTLYLESVNPGAHPGDREVFLELFPNIGPHSSLQTLIAGDHAEFVSVSMSVDANRDGIVRFDGSDATTEEKPYQIWANDDDDTQDGSGEFDRIPVVEPDWKNDRIENFRDLEDFFRIQIRVQGHNDAFKSERLLLALRWTDVDPDRVGEEPSIKVFKHVEKDGGLQYLRDMDVAADQILTRPFSNQIDPTNTLVKGSEPFIFSRDVFTSMAPGEATANLLFEGCTTGMGRLEVLIVARNLDNSYEVVHEADSVWIDIRPIKAMYERAKVTTNFSLSGNGIDYILPIPYHFTGESSPPVPEMGWAFDTRGVPFVPDPHEDLTDMHYVVFVHGWRQSPHEVLRGFPRGVSSSTNYAETMFKRLFQSGFRGRFVSFRWPTFYGTDDPGDDGNEWFSFRGVFTYNISEYRAWKSGDSLAQFVNQLSGDYRRSIVAHSMGNIVVGSGFQYGMEADRYLMLNSAVPAIAYDPAAPRFDPVQYLQDIGQIQSPTEPSEIQRSFPRPTMMMTQPFVPWLMSGSLPRFRTRSRWLISSCLRTRQRVKLGTSIIWSYDLFRLLPPLLIR